MSFVRLNTNHYLAVMAEDRFIEIDADTKEDAMRKLDWYTDDKPLVICKIPGVVNCIGKKDMFGDII